MKEIKLPVYLVYGVWIDENEVSDDFVLIPESKFPELNPSKDAFDMVTFFSDSTMYHGEYGKCLDESKEWIGKIIASVKSVYGDNVVFGLPLLEEPKQIGYAIHELAVEIERLGGIAVYVSGSGKFFRLKSVKDIPRHYWYVKLKGGSSRTHPLVRSNCTTHDLCTKPLHLRFAQMNFFNN